MHVENKTKFSDQSTAETSTCQVQKICQTFNIWCGQGFRETVFKVLEAIHCIKWLLDWNMLITFIIEHLLFHCNEMINHFLLCEKASFWMQRPSLTSLFRCMIYPSQSSTSILCRSMSLNYFWSATCLDNSDKWLNQLQCPLQSVVSNFLLL